MPVEFSQIGVSRYSQLATTFRRLIESGEWGVDSQIPTVKDLSAHYGVATGTVRQALDILDSAGLIARFRAKGTFVIRRPQTDLWCSVPTDWSGMLLAADGVDIEVLSTSHNVQPLDAKHSGGFVLGNYRHWRRRHSRNGQPYYIGDAYVAERWAARIGDRGMAGKTTLRALKEIPELRMAEVRQTLTVRTADMEIRELLGVPLHSPLAHVSRTAFDEERNVVFVGAGVYRGDVIRLDITASG